MAKYKATTILGNELSADQIGNLYGMLGNTVGSIGDITGNLSNQYYAQNAGRNEQILQQLVSGNDWSDVFNNSNKLSQGLQTISDSQKDYSDVKNNQNLLNAWDSNDLQSNIQDSAEVGGVIGSSLEDMGKLASVGSTFGPWGTVIGAGVGLASGLTRGLVSAFQHNSNADKINAAIERANQQQIDNFYMTAQNNQQREQRQAMMNYFDNGGSLDGLNGVTHFNVGGTHSENPNEGIQQGIASDGNPNLVEQDEIKYKDYIYSARLKPSKSLLDKYNLPDKYTGLSFAEIGDKLQKESEDRPNDPISLQTLDDWMSRLAGAQEEYKAKATERKLAKMIDNMSTEEKAAIMSSLVQPMAQEQEGIDLSQPMYKSGGKIHIKKANRGKFTASAKRAGMGVQEFARHVLANKDKYSSTQVKRANFARNSTKWHADGGHLFQWGGLTPTTNGFGETIFPQWNLDIDYSKLGDDIKYYPTTNQLNSGLDFNTLYNYNKAMNSNIQAPTFVTTPNAKGTVNTDLLAGRLGESLRYAPAVGAGLGALTAVLQPKDFTLTNQLREIASEYKPIAAPHVGGYRKYTPYDVNLGDAENLAVQAAALRANRGQNRATQAALNTAILDKMSKVNSERNLTAQQANEANRLAVDTYNRNIDERNAALTQAYDQLNQQILANRLRTLMSAAEAEDASKTAWAQNVSGTTENWFNQLGNVGRDEWNRLQMLRYLKNLGYEGIV